ncbi:hypothetical protein D3C86_1901070 [compost metagenome]
MYGCPHCPAPGVKVYVAVPPTAVDMTEGDQVPVKLFREVVGNAGGTDPIHKCGMGSKTGGRFKSTEIASRKFPTVEPPTDDTEANRNV